MARLIAPLLVIAVCLAVASAQPVPAQRQPAEQAPVLQVSQENGESVWRITRAGAVNISEILTHYVDHVSGTLAYYPQQTRAELTLVPPRAGAEYRGEQIDVLVMNALEAFRFCIVEVAPKTFKVVPASDAVAHAPTLTPEELAVANPGRYYTCLVPLKHADANTMTGMLRNLTTRQGGMVQPVQTANVVVISDRWDRVKDLVALTQEIDAKLKPVVRFYAVPEEVDPDDAVKLLTELVSGDPRREIKFAAMQGKQGVIASAPADVHTHIEAIVAAMK